ncbi:T9SS type A sorting domain-containing protein [Niastella caeni]|uniref:T9SS type A sorting domain-containing protein n=1 Tax=Niastella caeni TaxID=2569763 RepID=A0A4S8I024_9BACT|nr:T9SS type A sorting domain-containing protein [Niastella caeni]THU39804.1 T9SS type A sorting domain-containing protein [Niastella caeni]
MNRPVLPILFLLLLCSTAWAQTPGVTWSKYVKTDGDLEAIYDGQRTNDKGYILVGYDTGWYDNDENFILNKANTGRPWVVKLDSNGTRTWWRGIGANPHESALLSVREVTGGYITAGYERIYPDPANYLISKVDVSGNSLWEKTYGGSGSDRPYAVRPTIDGGYIVAGYSNSADGDVIQLHAGAEAWIVKLDANGNKVWTKTYGGTSTDTAYAICQMPDGGYLVCGTTSSANGDVPANNGGSDGWVFKLDALGTLVWKKNFGGGAQDVLNSVIKNDDNTYTLSGYTFSNDGDVSGNHGQADVWVIKIDDTGNLIWSKVYGGSRNDAAFGLHAGFTSGSFVTGFTESSDGQITDAAGRADCWTLRLDESGNLLWQKSSGTVNDEYAMVIMPKSDVEFTIAGFGYPLTQPVGWTDYNDGLVIKYGYANTIKGTLFYDANSNGIKDVGEGNFDNAIVKTVKSGDSLSAMPYNGAFSLDVDTGTFTTSVLLFTPYYNVVPASQSSTFSTYYNQDSIGFAVQPLPGKKDLFIMMRAVDPARPGFDVRYQLFYKNVGTMNMPTGTVQLTIDPKFSYLNASTAPTSITGNTITWNYTNLNSLDAGSIFLTIRLAAPPTTNIGDTLRSVAVIGPVTGDETPADDTAVLKQIVTGSFDPNDKTEANAGVITPAQVNNGEYLNYQIRFQNLGTDTAFNITVRDTLESRLDWNSLQMISASHAYQLAIEDGNKLTWQFNNIELPYSGIDEPNSHGYILYRIKPLSTVQIGDTIKNGAGIYFDFNLPVATNIERTVVLSLTPLPVTLSSFLAAMDGEIVNITWTTSIEEQLKHFEVQRSANGIDFTTIGIVQPGQKSYLFKDKQPLKGYNYYRLKSVDIDGSFSFSTYVLVNVENGAGIISSLYPNPATGNAILKLQGTVEGKVLVQVLDQQGRMVATKQFGVQHTGEFKTPLDLGNLPKGSYVLRIVVNDKSYLQKMLVQ